MEKQMWREEMVTGEGVMTFLNITDDPIRREMKLDASSQ